MALSSYTIGIIFAIISAIGNGSFTVPSKLPFVRSQNVDPYVFNFYACVGIAGSSFIPLAFGFPFVFTPLGILSGILFAVSSANAFQAVRCIGVSVGQGLWCGVAVVVSFAFGQLFETRVSKMILALVGLGVLLLGIIGIASSSQTQSPTAEEEPLLDYDEERRRNTKRMAGGLVAAVLAGVFGGLIVAPMTWAPSSAKGLGFLPSLGIGAFFGGLIVNAVPFCFSGRRPHFHLGHAALPGVLSGLIWNIANACSIIAIQKIHYSIAYPIMQAGLFVAGIWGMCLFREIQGTRAIVYWLSGLVLIAGVVVLSLSLHSTQASATCGDLDSLLPAACCDKSETPPRGAQSGGGGGPSRSGAGRSGSQSVFYRDLSHTPLARGSSLNLDPATPAQATAAAAAALWRESAPSPADPPPPPCMTLEDYVERTPEGATPLRPVHTPDTIDRGGGGGGGLGQPGQYSGDYGQLARGLSGGLAGPSSFSRSYSRGYGDGSPGFGSSPPGGAGPARWSNSPQSAGQAAAGGGGGGGASPWWSASPLRQGSGTGAAAAAAAGSSGSLWGSPGATGSPVAGVVHGTQGGLLTLPPPREVVRPEPKDGISSADAPEDCWVTVFGCARLSDPTAVAGLEAHRQHEQLHRWVEFGADDTNEVLREFEKCGPIVAHVCGPAGANWLHIQYQDSYDARKALLKNGSQISSSLIVGVNAVTNSQSESLVSKVQKGGGQNAGSGSFGVKTSGKGNLTPVLQAARPYYLHPNQNKGAVNPGIAHPIRSTAGRWLDYVFGV
eukprot:jgi/Mesen1/7755/ME000408S06871